ncbi:MAG: NAD(P)-dependent oxidoreductase [Thomasclavelia sp.]
MKVAVIGGSGNLGKRVVHRLLKENNEVTGYVYRSKYQENGVTVIKKNLFDLTKTEIMNYDVIISAFGGGFNVDPVINKKAFIKYKELLHDSDTNLIAIAGAESLYVDKDHQMFEYQSANHPQKLKEISRNIRLGIEELKQDLSFNWIVVCPSRQFDLNGGYTGQYIIDDNEEIIFNDDQESYVTYDDLAKAMVDLAKEKEYFQKVITVVTKTKKKK